MHPVNFGTALPRGAKSLEAPGETGEDNDIKQLTTMSQTQAPVEEKATELPEFSPSPGYGVLNGRMVLAIEGEERTQDR
eukprot:5859904-Amphidinium_carterae.6